MWPARDWEYRTTPDWRKTLPQFTRALTMDSLLLDIISGFAGSLGSSMVDLAWTNARTAFAISKMWSGGGVLDWVVGDVPITVVTPRGPLGRGKLAVDDAYRQALRWSVSNHPGWAYGRPPV